MRLFERTLDVVWKELWRMARLIEIVLFVVIIPLVAWACGAGLMLLLLWLMTVILGAIGAFGGC